MKTGVVYPSIYSYLYTGKMKKILPIFYLIGIIIFTANTFLFAWPTATQWIPMYMPFSGQKVPAFDAVQTPADSRDIVGSSSTYPCAYLLVEGTTMYLRLRLNDNAWKGTSQGLDQYNWGIYVDTDTNANNYEFMLSIDGSASKAEDEIIQLRQNTTKGTIGEPSDPADTVLSTMTAVGNFQYSVADSSSDGTNADYFLDFLYPYDTFIQKTGVTDNTPIRLFFGVGTVNAFNEASGDVVGGTVTTSVKLWDGFSRYITPKGPEISTGTVKYVNDLAGSGDMTEMLAGATAYIRVDDSDQNSNSASSQTVTVTLTAVGGGDIEISTLTEISVSTYIFTGYIRTVSSSGYTTYNGIFQVSPGSTITVTYTDAVDGSQTQPLLNQSRTDTLKILNNPPDSFSLYTPTGSVVVYELTPNFDWGDSTDLDGHTVNYELRYSTASDFSVYSYQTGLTSSTYIFDTTPLTNYTTYYWRVKAYDNYTPSPGTTWATNPSTGVFITSNTLPSAFNLISPTNASVVTTSRPTFDWGDSSDPDPGDYVRYEIRYSSASNFSVYTSSMNLSTSTYICQVDLLSDSTYYWKVYAYDTNSATTTSTQTNWEFYVRFAQTAILDGSLGAPTYENVYYVPASSTTVQTAIFTVDSAISTDTITAITLSTASPVSLSSNLAADGIKIWLDTGTANYQWDSADGLASAGATLNIWTTSATFSSLSLATSTETTKTYIITVDIAAGASDGAKIALYVSTVTCTNASALSDSIDATIVIDTAPPTVVFTPGTPLVESYSQIVTSGTSDFGAGSPAHATPYHIQRSTSNDFVTVSDSGWISTGTVWSSLDANTTYWFRIQARDALGNTSVWSSTT
ncbi:MAG TPA: hypothetical protein DHV62_03370, partial [Elusimicrobia bacterium]|nr:hypothetical protein [Elusimicrobiota bacterium]